MSISYQSKPPIVYRTKEACQLAQLLYTELSTSREVAVSFDQSVPLAKFDRGLFHFVSYQAQTSLLAEDAINLFLLQDGIVAILYCPELSPVITVICKDQRAAENLGGMKS